MVHELNIELSVVLEEEQEERLYDFLQEELDYNGEFVVLEESTKEEYLIRIQEYTLWAYNVDFIMENLKEEVAEELSDSEIKELTKSVTKAVENLCEYSNSLIKGITNWKEMILAGAQHDGFGRYISLHDGEEHEVEFEGMNLLVYKC